MRLIPRFALPRLAAPARPRTLLRYAAAVAAVAVVLEAVRVFAVSNRHTVIPGRVYRCAQPTAGDLRELVAQRGIRTVINLRGVSPDFSWYQEEARTTHALNVSQEDVTFSANRLPAPAELRRLIDVLDHTEYPVLVHCKAGADRTGMTSAIVLLLQTDATLAQARRQLWPRYGHFEFGRTAAMDDFLNRYEAWLKGRAAGHTPARFREWTTAAYSPGPHLSKLTWLDPVPNPVPRDRPLSLRVRAENTSAEPWEMKPGNQAGIHLAWAVASDPLTVVFRGQAGLMRATVPPGGHIDLTVAVPPLKVPGKYALVAEMTDATGAGVPIRANSFVQFGDEAVLAEVVVE